MKRILSLLIAVLGIGGGFYVAQNGVQSLPTSVGGKLNSVLGGIGERAAGDERLTIATFNIQVFGTSKLNKPEVVDVLVKIVRRFDVVAIQEIRANDQTVITRFVEALNATGRHYDYALGPRLGRTSSKEQYAFVFDTDTVEIDRSAIYTVADPDDLLHREPLVAAFRARQAEPEQAFTFTLVNIHTDPDEVSSELNALDDVLRAVRRDGRGEDDVILLGDLNADDEHLGELGQMTNIACALQQTPTNTRHNHMYDNLIYDRRATVEIEGGAGVLDFAAEFGLTIEQALEVSDHMPVWAQFSIYEGASAGDVASRPGATNPR